MLRTSNIIMKTAIEQTVKRVHKKVINRLVSKNSVVFAHCRWKGSQWSVARASVAEARGAGGRSKMSCVALLCRTCSFVIRVVLPRSSLIMSP